MSGLALSNAIERLHLCTRSIVALSPCYLAWIMLSSSLTPLLTLCELLCIHLPVQASLRVVMSVLHLGFPLVQKLQRIGLLVLVVGKAFWTLLGTISWILLSSQSPARGSNRHGRWCSSPPAAIAPYQPWRGVRRKPLDVRGRLVGCSSVRTGHLKEQAIDLTTSRVSDRLHVAGKKAEHTYAAEKGFECPLATETQGADWQIFVSINRHVIEWPWLGNRR